uniref:Chorion class A n=1 Tax=Bombyx mori TaxID=7091 RepID=A0A0K2S3G9_BOMMO|nr:chorion class A [Bombyx mori]
MGGRAHSPPDIKWLLEPIDIYNKNWYPPAWDSNTGASLHTNAPDVPLGHDDNTGAVVGEFSAVGAGGINYGCGDGGVGIIAEDRGLGYGAGYRLYVMEALWRLHQTRLRLRLQ